MRTLRFVAIGGLVALAAASGCGYKIGTLHRSDVRTISIPVWTRGHGVYRRGLEMDLTKAVVNRIQMDTRYGITNEAKADTKLTGQLKNVRQRPLSINTDTGRSRAMEVTFTVSFRWVDLRSGDVLVSVDDFDVREQYIGAYTFGETFFTGGQAVIDEAAQRIVEQLEEGWPDPSDQADGDEKL
ncbi:MAG: LPS assembly lipoprotein LptE [Phycisphaerae bacterium]|jgi:ATP phosphoribosyltransferase regulatory subunit HisZ|nr:LPS assembly lipoprotein LptE [Phycisphaerae bacterium]